MKIEMEYKELSYEQLTHNYKLNRKCSIEEGLYVTHNDGWELVTSYPSRDYTGEIGRSTMFVFRKGGKR